MQKYEYAEKVKNKLIELLKYNLQCKKILEGCTYKCSYKLDKNANLTSIEFGLYDQIYCYTDGAMIRTYYNETIDVLEYESFDELLESEDYMKDCRKWIPVDSNNVADIMPEKDCEVWAARGGMGKGWIQKINYYSDQRCFDLDGIYAYQQVNGNPMPDPYIMRFAGGKTIVCEEFV